MQSNERRQHERKPVFYAAEAWTFDEESWVASQVRIYNESTEGVRLRCREDLSDKAMLLRLSPDADIAAVCDIVHASQVARDCWEYGIRLVDAVDFTDAIASAPQSTNDEVPKINIPKGHRYTPRHTLNATVRYEDEHEEELVRLTNFSSDGACFLTTEVPKTGASVVLTIHDQSESFEFLGIIRWAEPSDEGHWRTGCQFDQTTLRFGVPTTDSPDRIACSIPVDIRAADKPASMSGTIVNHSEGGIGIESSWKLIPGQRLMIESGDSHFYVRIEWCSVSEKTRAGAQFVALADRERFQDLISGEKPVVSLPPAPAASGSTRDLWSACLFIYGWLGLYLTNTWPV